MLERLRLRTPLMILALFPAGGFAQNRSADFQARFAQETDAMHRAQMMPKLGETEFEDITKNMDAGKLPEALAVLKEYRNEIRSCEKGLDARNIDAEKHPKGYKQLEISLRQSLRKLNNLLVNLTADEQAPFNQVRSDLEELNRHLIHELFPKTPNDDRASPD